MPHPQTTPLSLEQLAEHLLPLHGVRVEAEFVGYSQPSLFHEPALAALLKTVAQGDLEDEPLITLLAPESGRAQFQRGDRYRFDLLAAYPAAHKLPPLLLALLHSSERAPADPHVPFGRQFRVQRFLDPGDGSGLQGAQVVPIYGHQQLVLERAYWQAQSRIRLRLQSPLRILRDMDERGDAKGEARYVCDNDTLRRCLMPRLWASLMHLAKCLGQTLRAMPTVVPSVLDSDVFYIDWDYRSGAQSKPMGGLLGWVELDMQAADADWWTALLLAQRLGVGQRRSFGWGRFRLECPQGRGTVAARQRSRSLLQRAAEPANRIEALVVAAQAKDAPAALRGLGEARLRQQAFSASLRQDLDKAFAQLAAGQYCAAELQGSVLYADDGRCRPLAVPPWQDRLLQRAVHQVLSSDLETLMNDGSFGYRRGRSRFDVKRQIQSLAREGYQWYFEADITAFFDSLDLRRVHTRLASLLGDEPAMPLLMAWLQAPVNFMQRRVVRRRGLPQGAPISPLMANLVLEDLDARFAAEGLRLLRYADDFVALCRTREEAERAQALGQQRIEALGLQLKPDKTRIGHLSRDSMTFLGFRFVGDLVVDHPRAATGLRAPLQMPPASWLADLLRREPRLFLELERQHLDLADRPDAVSVEAVSESESLLHFSPATHDRPSLLKSLTEAASLGLLYRLGDLSSFIDSCTKSDSDSESLPSVPQRPTEVASAAQPAPVQPASPAHPQENAPEHDHHNRHTELDEAESGDDFAPGAEGADVLPEALAEHDEGQWLCLLDNCLIAQRQGRLTVLSEQHGGHDFAWSQLDAVLLMGHARITSGAIHAALDNGVPMHFLGGPQGYRGALRAPGSDLADLDFALRQRQRLADPDKALALARALVQARLHNQRETLRQRLREQVELQSALIDLGELAERVADCHDRAVLNGLEGSATRRYFDALGKVLRPPFRFEGRNRRPPRDPVNALLSLGYTVLYSRTVGLIHSAGLHPRLGFYHQAHGSHATLASDLMEPFRHLIERSVWTVLNRRELREDDFHTDPANGCRLSPAAKRIYLARLAQVFARRQTTHDDQHGNYHQLMQQQLRSLRQHIQGEGSAWFFRSR